MTLAFCNVATHASAGLRFLVGGCDESLAGIAAATRCVSEQAGEYDSWAHNLSTVAECRIWACPTSRPRKHAVIGVLGEVC